MRLISFTFTLLFSFTALAQVSVTPELADKVARSAGNNLVRIVKVPLPPAAKVVDTALGEVVEVAEIPSHAECNIILDAPPIERGKLTGDSTDKDIIPNTPELLVGFADLNWTIYQIPGSGYNGNFLWNVVLRGQWCLTAADVDDFVGSTGTEFLNEILITKTRLLRTTVIVDKIGITVPYGDPQAAVDAVWGVKHSWAGRIDFKFKNIKSGSVLPREVEAVAAEPEVIIP